MSEGCQADQWGLSRERIWRGKARLTLTGFQNSSGKAVIHSPFSLTRNREDGGRKYHGLNSMQNILIRDIRFSQAPESSKPKETSGATLRQIISSHIWQMKGILIACYSQGLAVRKSIQNDYVAKTTPSFCKLPEPSQRWPVTSRTHWGSVHFCAVWLQ